MGNQFRLSEVSQPRVILLNNVESTSDILTKNLLQLKTTSLSKMTCRSTNNYLKSTKKLLGFVLR